MATRPADTVPQREQFVAPTLSTTGFEQWSAPGDTGGAWEPTGFEDADGTTYVTFRRMARWYGDEGSPYEHCAVPLAVVLCDWHKDGHRYPDTFSCGHDGCAATVTDLEANAHLDGWSTWGWGATRCPEHADS